MSAQRFDLGLSEQAATPPVCRPCRCSRWTRWPCCPPGTRWQFQAVLQVQDFPASRL